MTAVCQQQIILLVAKNSILLHCACTVINVSTTIPQIAESQIQYKCSNESAGPLISLLSLILLQLFVFSGCNER
jgi:hypothetical protein